MATAVVGAACLSMVQAHEGLRLKPYYDPVGIPTVCYGHTGPDVKMGTTYTVAQCDRILIQDLSKHRAGIERCITAPLTANQRDAVVSFAFNLGVTKTCKSTLVRKLNRRDYIGAADEFPKWDKARVNGRLVALRGLTKRRAAERALFLTPMSQAASQARLTRIQKEDS